MLLSLLVSPREEGQPGWAIFVPWTLRVAWYQPCVPQQVQEPDATLRFHLLLRPVKLRMWLLRCLPWRLPGFPAALVGWVFRVATLLRGACVSWSGWLMMLWEISGVFEAAVGPGVRWGCTLQLGQFCLFWDVPAHRR